MATPTAAARSRSATAKIAGPAPDRVQPRPPAPGPPPAPPGTRAPGRPVRLRQQVPQAGPAQVPVPVCRASTSAARFWAWATARARGTLAGRALRAAAVVSSRSGLATANSRSSGHGRARARPAGSTRRSPPSRHGATLSRCQPPLALGFRRAGGPQQGVLAQAGLQERVQGHQGGHHRGAAGAQPAAHRQVLVQVQGQGRQGPAPGLAERLPGLERQVVRGLGGSRWAYGPETVKASLAARADLHLVPQGRPLQGGDGRSQQVEAGDEVADAGRGERPHPRGQHLRPLHGRAPRAILSTSASTPVAVTAAPAP